MIQTSKCIGCRRQIPTDAGSCHLCDMPQEMLCECGQVASLRGDPCPGCGKTRRWLTKSRSRGRLLHSPGARLAGAVIAVVVVVALAWLLGDAPIPN